MFTIASLPAAEDFVENQKRLGSDIRWDGWDIVFHKENPRAFYSALGVFRNERWGYDNRAALTRKGTWEIDYRNVKRR